MNCIVFYECWQMECCGKPFAVGDNIKWLVKITAQPLNTPVDIGNIDYCYEAHSSDWQNIFVLEGKVKKIQILYERYAPSADNPRLLAAVGGTLINSEYAKRFENKKEDKEPSGYVVGLSECSVRKAGQEKVTFR